MSIVTQERLETVVEEIKKAALLDNRQEEENLAATANQAANEYLHIIDAFDVPRYTYKPLDKCFVKCVLFVHDVSFDQMVV
jgi:hypothetical protein